MAESRVHVKNIGETAIAIGIWSQTPFDEAENSPWNDVVLQSSEGQDFLLKNGQSIEIKEVEDESADGEAEVQGASD